ncbi:MAG: hypothetical protein ABJ308_03050 [Halieaceae bacterium]
MAPMTRWRSHVQWLPVVILLGVALNQQRLAHFQDLSPWSGGGFGMFASTDSPADRHLHVYELSQALRRELDIPPGLEEEARRALTLPTEYRLDKLSRLLREELQLPPQVAVEIQVWMRDYDAGNLTPRGRLLRHFRDDGVDAAR